MPTVVVSDDQDLDPLEVQDREEEVDAPEDELVVATPEDAPHAIVEPDVHQSLIDDIDKVAVPVDGVQPSLIDDINKVAVPLEEDSPVKAKPHMVSEELIHRPLRLDELEDKGLL